MESYTVAIIALRRVLLKMIIRLQIAIGEKYELLIERTNISPSAMAVPRMSD